MHNKFLPLFVALIFMQAIAVAQTCIKITKPADTITMPCTQNCTGFTIKVPGLHANTGYNVQSTTYNPNPFINSGTAVGFLDGEDGFSDSITLPFPFALYDSAYDKVVIAVDGFITFNKAVAKTSSIFNGLGYPSLPNNFLTEASIVAIKEDLWLTAPTAISTTRVDTITLGTAPCRKFVISWNNVPQYFCTNNLVTAQIVLYEGSNIVETYIKTRPVCAGSEGNNSFIMGMQNWARNLAVIPPGRAQSTIAINNEAWQYTPNGAAFLFQESDLYLNNQLLGPGDTTRINQDTMSVFFDEICPDVGESQNLKIYTKYLLATNSPQQFILTDSIVIRKLTCNPLVFTSVNTDPTCFGSTNGSIVIHASGGTSPYTFSINGTSYFTDSTFSNLAAGTYTLYVKDATNTIVTSQATLTAPPQLTGSTSITNLACPFSSSGSITVTAGGGTPPYQYSLDGGSFQSSNIFSGLIAGGHTIIIKDAHNCTLQLSATVTQPPAFVYSSSATIPSCFGASNGTVTINVTGGTPPYLFSLNSGPFQSSNVFTGLPAGTYLSQIKDANNCLITGPSAVLGQPTAINGTTTVVNLLCAGASTGSITVSATGGVGGYQYSLT
ncbi:MAG TPA: hypothetical protein VKH37_04135, partial [Ferruginibacter sp.]|nr:hypothetical protein [Ferruginibacter sp.]